MAGQWRWWRVCRVEVRDSSEGLHGLPRHAGVSRAEAAAVPQLGRQPYLQATVERRPACCHQPAEVLPADPHRVAVQVVPDDRQLTARFFGRELRAPVLPPHHPADVVADTAAVHATPPSAGPPRRLRAASRSTPSASSSSAAGSGRRRDSRASRKWLVSILPLPDWCASSIARLKTARAPEVSGGNRRPNAEAGASHSPELAVQDHKITPRLPV